MKRSDEVMGTINEEIGWQVESGLVSEGNVGEFVVVKERNLNMIVCLWFCLIKRLER